MPLPDPARDLVRLRLDRCPKLLTELQGAVETGDVRGARAALTGLLWALRDVEQQLGTEAEG